MRPIGRYDGERRTLRERMAGRCHPGSQQTMGHAPDDRATVDGRRGSGRLALGMPLAAHAAWRVSEQGPRV